MRMRYRLAGPLLLAGLLAAACGAAGAGEGPAADGGLAELSPDDVRVLREARDLLQNMAADEQEPDHMRTEALGALNRIHEALSDWDRPGLAQWYLDLLAGPKGHRLEGPIVQGGEAAARAGQYHLGGVRAFWGQLEALAAERGGELAQRLERAQKLFLSRTARFEKPRWRPPNVKPLQLKPARINPARLPKPYPEPKPGEAKP